MSPSTTTRVRHAPPTAPSVTASPLLAVRDVIVQRGDYAAVRGVSFEVGAGEFVAVIGRSGAGKTTLIHTLGGLLQPASGTVHWNPVSDPSRNGHNGHAPHRAVLFQHYRLVPQLTALTNVLGGRLREYPWWRTLLGFPAGEKDRACELLHSVGMAGKCKLPARRLSGGEQQRVAVARALIQEPEALLADEPVASLDAETANEVMELFRSLNRNRGLTILCVMHDLEMAERFARRVLLLDQGKLVYDGPSRNLQGTVRDQLQWKTLS